MSKASLLALADRAALIRGPDRELEAAIIEAFGWKRKVTWFREEYWHRDGERVYRSQIAPCTVSVNIAMLLVPKGAGVTISRYWAGDRVEPAWSCETATGGVPSNPRQVFDCYDAWTQAAAVCAAGLRARASMEEA